MKAAGYTEKNADGFYVNADGAAAAFTLTVNAAKETHVGYALQITLPAVLLSTVIGLLWGLRCGYKKGSGFEKFSTTFQIIVNPCPEKGIATTIALWKHSLAG